MFGYGETSVRKRPISSSGFTPSRMRRKPFRKRRLPKKTAVLLCSSAGTRTSSAMASACCANCDVEVKRSLPRASGNSRLLPIARAMSRGNSGLAKAA